MGRGTFNLIDMLIGDTFICFACDEKGGITIGDHKDTHTLAQVYKYRTVYESTDDEDRSDHDGSDREARTDYFYLQSNTESQLISLGRQLTGMGVRFGAVESKLERLEGMLETVLSLLRAPHPSTGTVECGVGPA